MMQTLQQTSPPHGIQPRYLGNPSPRYDQSPRYPPQDKLQKSNYSQFHPYKPYLKPGETTEFDGKRLRKSVMRKTVDYNAAVIKMLEGRVWQRDFRDRRALQPDICYYPEMHPPPAYVDNAINSVTTKFVKTATNKMRCPIFCLSWTPEGRRLVTGASSGEFTLWNGLTFNFETILQAHDSPVRTMVWSHNDVWMVTADHGGYVKYWQSNMNNVKMFQAHKEPIRGLSFSPTDQKFTTCSDDGTVRVWDFLRCFEEKILRGHGADVKCVDWHPQKGLLVSGSKDNQQPVKIWDPKSGHALATLHAHKSTVMDVKWNQNGNWLITASRDHLLKLFDVRNLSQEVQTFRGHKKEASSVCWHPIHEGLFCSGGSDGAILFWHCGADKEVGAIDMAHDSIVWTLSWHPLGHILCSGSNDHTSKFWTRNRPGDKMRDKYNLNTLPVGATGQDDMDMDEPGFMSIPGMGPDDRVDDLSLKLKQGSTDLGRDSEIPGLDFEGIQDQKPLKKVPYAKPIPKNFQAQWNETKKHGNDDREKEEKEDSRKKGRGRHHGGGKDSDRFLDMHDYQGKDDKDMREDMPEPAPAGAIPLSELQAQATAVLVGGRLVPITSGSALANAFSEGVEKFQEVLSSEIKQMNGESDENKPEEMWKTNWEDDGSDSAKYPHERGEHRSLQDRGSRNNWRGKSYQKWDMGDKDMRNFGGLNFMQTHDQDMRFAGDQDVGNLGNPCRDHDFRSPGLIGQGFTIGPEHTVGPDRGFASASDHNTAGPSNWDKGPPGRNMAAGGLLRRNMGPPGGDMDMRNSFGDQDHRNMFSNKQSLLGNFQGMPRDQKNFQGPVDSLLGQGREQGSILGLPRELGGLQGPMRDQGNFQGLPRDKQGFPGSLTDKGGFQDSRREQGEFQGTPHNKGDFQGFSHEEGNFQGSSHEQGNLQRSSYDQGGFQTMFRDHGNFQSLSRDQKGFDMGRGGQRGRGRGDLDGDRGPRKRWTEDKNLEDSWNFQGKESKPDWDSRPKGGQDRDNRPQNKFQDHENRYRGNHNRGGGQGRGGRSSFESSSEERLLIIVKLCTS